jgi:tetratricopeptide (TPR) repeat protein
LTEALRIRREQPDTPPVDLAASCFSMAWYYHERGDFPIAEKLYRESLAIRKQVPGEDGRRLTASTLQNLAWMLSDNPIANGSEPEALFRDALDIRTKLYGPLHRDVVFSKFGLALTLIEQGKSLAAAPLVLEATSDLVRLEADAPARNCMNQLAMGLIARDTIGEQAAVGPLQAALKSGIAALGPDSIYVGVMHFLLGRTLLKLERLPEALEQFEITLKIAREQGQMHHPRVTQFINEYAFLLIRLGRIKEIRPLWEELLAAQRSRFGPEHPFVANAMRLQGMSLRSIADYDHAAQVLKDALAILRRRPDATPKLVADTLLELGRCYMYKDLQAAEVCLREALQHYRTDAKAYRNVPSSEARCLSDLGSVLFSQGRFDESRRQLAMAIDAAKKITDSDRDSALKYAIETANFCKQESDFVPALVKRLPGARKLATAYERWSFSPDGSHIACIVGNKAGIMRLKTLDVATGETKDLLPDAHSPAWQTGTGQWIAFERWKSNDLIGVASAEIWIVPAAGGAPRKLCQGSFPSWSADGKTVYCFSRSRGAIIAVHLSDPNGTEPAKFATANNVYSALSYDGKCIVVPKGFESTFTLNIVDVASGNVIRTCPLPGWRLLIAGWSPDGKQIAFGSALSKPVGLWLMDVETGRKAQVADGPWTTPVWSPDGRKFTFRYSGSDTNSIWIVDSKELPSLKSKPANK